MLAIWKTVAPQVMAFTKCSVETRWGSSAELAGPLNARPDPIRNSTAKIGSTLCSPLQGEDQQRQGAQYLENVADQDHLAAVVAVGDMAGRQQK